MLRWIIIIIAGFLIWKLFIGDKKQKKMKQEKQAEAKYDSGEMVKDPVCGTYVPIDNDIRVKNGDKVLHFCSYECRDKYIQQIKGQDAKSLDEEDQNSQN